MRRNTFGIISLFLATLCLGAVLCFHFPHLLTTPELREVYSVPFLRSLLAFSILIAFSFGAIDVLFNAKPKTGWMGILIATISMLLGGPNVELPNQVRQTTYIGLDWFIIDLLIVTLIFVPMEKVFKRLPQNIFRAQWKTDLLHFFFSHILIQVTSLLIMSPALLVTKFISPDSLQVFVVGLPIFIQVFLIILLADFTQYWVHRAFHQIPLLWRFHEIHHSSKELDWLAGSRLHLFDIILTRGLTFVPLFFLGFSEAALTAYLVIVAFWATFIHANVSFKMSLMDNLLVTPKFHHWHHSSDEAAIDKNFSVHLPIFDRLFGTYYLPYGWPREYGVKGAVVPDGYFEQILRPLKKRPNST